MANLIALTNILQQGNVIEKGQSIVVDDEAKVKELLDRGIASLEGAAPQVQEPNSTTDVTEVSVKK